MYLACISSVTRSHPTFIVYAPTFDADVGGNIALHRLCDLINEEGEIARLWPMRKPAFDRRRPLRSAQLQFRYRRERNPFTTFSGFNTPIATGDDLRDSIVIYPEIVRGNPLRAPRVVRWFLHRPGFHTSGRVDYGSSELYFFFQYAFDDPAINPHSDHLLQALFVRDDIYRQSNYGTRSGSCYILRKGRGRALVHDLENSVLVDGLPHEECARIFNERALCVSYDPYTMYSQYAAMCGCTSVIIPEEGVSRDAWQPDADNRYGLAYGFDNIEYANATRAQMIETLKRKEREANETVRLLIERCYLHFQIDCSD